MLLLTKTNNDNSNKIYALHELFWIEKLIITQTKAAETNNKWKNSYRELKKTMCTHYLLNHKSPTEAMDGSNLCGWSYVAFGHWWCLKWEMHRNIFGIVCLVTVLIFLHLLHLSAQLNVSTSVISSTLDSFLRTDIVSLTFVLLMFLFNLIFSQGRLLVLYFSFVAPAICYLFFLHVVLYVFLANKGWWWNTKN